MPKSLEADPKSRILDTAEKAFVDSGFAGAPLREIIRAARVNLATYYFFESKEGLIAATINRLFSR